MNPVLTRLIAPAQDGMTTVAMTQAKMSLSTTDKTSFIAVPTSIVIANSLKTKAISYTPHL